MPPPELNARRLTPEVLDHLDPRDVSARRSRADLRTVNAAMMQASIMARLLRRARPKGGPVRVLDIGAGDGSFILAVARRLGPAWSGSKIVLLDRIPNLVSADHLAGFDRLGWTATCVTNPAERYLESCTARSFDLVTANLVLHHFAPRQLAVLLAQIAAAADAFVACEPRRCRVALTGAGLLWAVGANAVTRHDARVSVEAGFRHGELSAMWPSNPPWALLERPAGMFSHAFLALREQLS